MARIFLSYAREDVAKAKSLANALERADHSVWWDPHIGGGARFAAEIATALKNCEVVVVLWSRHSIHSTWVQDEAAEGRDSGRLIPVSLDDCRPPLGFRQFQAVDVSKWSGRGRAPNLAAIEGAIQTVLKGGTLARPSEPPRRRTWKLGAAAAAIALLLVAVAALYGTGQFTARTQAASLAVMPFADLSPQRDKGYFADGVAEEVRTLLSEVPGVQVTGRSSTESIGPKADFKRARQKLGVTHILEGSMSVHGQKMRLHVRLLRTSDGMQVWAEEFDRDIDDIFAVQDEVGAAVAQRLRGTLWRASLERRSIRTSIQTFDLVLAAEAKWNEQNSHHSLYDRALKAEQMLKKAIEIDPDYAPAWVARSRNVFVIINNHPEGAWSASWLRDREVMLRYAKRAVALDAESADAHAWLGFVEGNKENPEVALARIERAIKLNPGDWRVWGLASLIFQQMCEHDRQTQALRRLAAVEPLDLGNQVALLWELEASGSKGEAEALRRKLSQDPALEEEISLASAVQRGDFSTAITMIRRDVPPGDSFWNLRAAHMAHGLGATDSAVAWLPSDYKKSLGAFWQHDYRRAADAADWLRHGYWDTARGFALTRSLVYSGQHQRLVRLFDERFGSVKEFDRRLRCHVPALAAPIVTALRAEGRAGEAERLIQVAERRFRQGLAQHHYDEDIDIGYVELLLVAGRANASLAALDQAVRRVGLRGSPPPVVRLDLASAIYNPIRNHPRFKAVEERLSAWHSKELRELAAAGVKL